MWTGGRDRDRAHMFAVASQRGDPRRGSRSLDLNWKEHHRQPTILFADRPWVLSDASDHRAAAAQTRAEGSNTEARQ